MPAVVKINLDAALACGKPVVVELGCGLRKRPGAIGIDRQDSPQVDIIQDLQEGLPFLPDSSIDELHASHLLEHIEDFEGLMREIVRVLKPEGRCHVTVPHFTNPYGYSDYTHKRTFGLYTFYYFVAPEQQLSRKVPNYCPDVRIRILSIRFIFRGRKRLLRFLTRAFAWLVNLSSRSKEWYEANPWASPCDEVRVVFTPDK